MMGINTNAVPKSYFGGKGGSGVYQTIINEIPLHDIYIEPFLGGGSILLKKRPAQKSFGIDKDKDAIINFAKKSQGKIDNLNLLVADALEFMVEMVKTPMLKQKYFIFIDPPYLLSTRKSQERYKFELTDQDHVELIKFADSLNKQQFKVAISTYPNEIYRNLLTTWRVVEYNSVDRAGNVRKEQLYCNYEKPKILHDPSFLGATFEKRSDINKRIKRNVEKLTSWNPNERVRLISHMLATMSHEEKKAIESMTGSINV